MFLAFEDNELVRTWSMSASILGWLLVWGFWLSLTRRFHPTFALALIVTTSLVCAFAAAVYCNHLIYVPRFWMAKKPWQYVAWLTATMALFTALALAVIRISYFSSVGPDADPFGLVKHYLIDLFGMFVHVSVAALIVSWTRPLFKPTGS